MTMIGKNKANVEIHTTHDLDLGTTGEVHVNGKLILVIHQRGIIDHSTRNTTFSEKEIKEMDRLIKEWINANLQTK